MGTADRTAYLLANPKELEAFVIAAEKNADDWLALNREAQVLVEFAKTAPGRLPPRVQEAIAHVSGVTPSRPFGPEPQDYLDPSHKGTRPCPHCDAPPGYVHGSSCPSGVDASRGGEHG